MTAADVPLPPLGPQRYGEVAEAIEAQIGRVIVGQHQLVRQVLVGLLCEGHALLEGVPGLGKTQLLKTLSDAVDLPFSRIQFTPDLMPADILGTQVLVDDADDRRRFRFQPGPIFAGLVLADEVNRATPKTQSALLEAMEERQVTVDSTTYTLEAPFMVLATQNPIEHEGTYPLPRSQLDRFLMRVTVGYPGRESEMKILHSHGDGDVIDSLEAVATAKDVMEMAMTARTVHVAPSLQGYLVDVAETTRRHPALALGMSPRATLALQRVARARAAASGRVYVVPDDLKALAHPVVAHRLILTPEAQLQGVRPSDVLDDVLRHVPVPTGKGDSS